MPRAVVGRWGKNLAIRFPAEVAEAARLIEGERVEIAASGDEVVIRRLPAEVTVEALFAGKGRRPGGRSTAALSTGARTRAASASRNERRRIFARRRRSRLDRF